VSEEHSDSALYVRIGDRHPSARAKRLMSKARKKYWKNLSAEEREQRRKQMSATTKKFWADKKAQSVSQR
jgi:hypothetical protein